MFNPENAASSKPEKAQLQQKIEALRKTKIVNQSDPEYAAEIQEEIDRLEEELENA